MELALGWPYSLGVVAAFNPCGFAMLPAWLSYFIGAGGPDRDSNLLKAALRGLVVGLTLTAGFIAVFGGFGLLFETILSRAAVLDRIGWVTMAVGVGMVGLGAWMASGRELNLRLPKMAKGTSSRGLGSVFMFGVSYAVVSLSCTIGLFIASVGATFTNRDYATGVANFVAYAAGMGSVIIFLTLSLAMARTNVAARMRKLLPHITRISGVMLVAAGIYLVNYGWWELRILDDPTATNAAVQFFETLQADVSNWIADTTPARLGVISLFGITGALLLAWRQTGPDALPRRAVTAAYVLAYLVVEVGFNQGDLVVGPVVRFAASWPERVGNWFTDPIRFGVAIEALFAVGAIWLLWRLLRRAFRSRGNEPASDQPALSDQR